MDTFDYKSMIHNLNQLQWLDYKYKHMYSMQKMDSLCLYLMLRLYYCDTLSFYDIKKLACCNALCTVHFVKHAPNFNNALNLTYELTSTGRNFVKKCVPHHLLMFSIEYLTVGIKKILYLLLFTVFFIILFHYQDISNFFDIPSDLVCVTLGVICFAVWAFIMLLFVTDANPILKGTQIEYVNKLNFVRFIDQYCNRDLNHSRIIDVIEYSLFKKKNR